MGDVPLMSFNCNCCTVRLTRNEVALSAGFRTVENKHETVHRKPLSLYAEAGTIAPDGAAAGSTGGPTGAPTAADGSRDADLGDATPSPSAGKNRQADCTIEIGLYTANF